MEKTLQMVFLNNTGKNVSLNISGVKDNVTAAEIKALMELIVAKNVFSSTGGDLKSVLSASIVSRDTETLSIR